jgi:type II restriction enzyme
MEIFHPRVTEAQHILAVLELPAPLRSKLAALTLLALAGVGPDTPWVQASNQSKGMSRGIRDFIRTAYAWPDASTEHTFLLIRNQVLLPLVATGLVLRNPDNRNLAGTSPRLHFALTPELLPVLRLYGTPPWPATVAAFQQAREIVLPAAVG